VTAASEHLTGAAEALDALIRAGQRELARLPGEARIAAHMRDQVAAGLANTITSVLPQVGQRSDRLALAVVVPLVRGLQARTSGLDAPPVLQLLQDPPATSSARGWIRAAVEIEQVAVQVARSGAIPPQELRALATDLAAVSSALVFADEDLGRALQWSDDPALQGAARSLLDGGAAQLRRDALRALDVLHGDGPRYYDLAEPAPPVGAVRQIGDIPTVLRLVEDRILDAPLTQSQHGVMARSLAAITHRLRGEVLRESGPTDTDVAIRAAVAVDDFVRAQMSVAAIWGAVQYLRYGDEERAGGWLAAVRLQNVAEVLAPEHRNSVGRFEPEQLRQTLSLLSRLARSVNENFTDSLTRGQWQAAELGPSSAVTWGTVLPVRAAGLDDVHAVRFEVGDGLTAHLAGLTALKKVLAAQDVTGSTARGLRVITGPAERTASPQPEGGPRPILAARDVLSLSPAPVMPGTATRATTPEQLAVFSDLVHATLESRLAAAVVTDPQWPAAVAQLNRAAQLLPDGGLSDALRALNGHVDPAGKNPARTLLLALHASTAASPGVRLTSQTHTTEGRAGRQPRTARADQGAARPPNQAPRELG
jgi:hypothetical protein